MQAEWELAQRAAARGDWDAAAVAYRAILSKDPGFLPGWIELSAACEKLDAYREAHAAVIQASSIIDVPPMAALIVARKLRRFEELPRLQDYVEQTRLAERLPPEKLLDLASFLSSAGDHGRAEDWVGRVLQQRPNLPDAHNLLGLLRMFAGDDAGSVAAFEHALTLRPGFASVYSVRSRLPGIGPQNHHVDALRRLLAQSDLPGKDEGHLAYALHNELHALGDVDGAWSALQRGFRARRQEQSYDHAATLRMFDTLRAIFDTRFLQGQTFDDPLTPIFIVGLHRSGTTLLERILAGHADVADAGETYALPAQLRLAADHGCEGVIDQVIADRSPGLDYAAIGRGFLETMRRRSGGRGFITEKQNPNFIALGHIAKALPQAKLLHIQRGAADVCFSNLRTLFTLEAAYSYDQIEMADYYKAYRDLMAHWRALLPARLLDIDYQALVSNPESEARRIAEHCGFDFQPAMLRLDRSSGRVATASAAQVRTGISTQRGGLWQAYEKHLSPMLERLAAHDML